MSTGLPPEVSGGLYQVLDALAEAGFDGSQQAREERLRALSEVDTAARVNLGVLMDNAKMQVYGRVGADGRNPF
ncbi:MAG TPA: hypothetical protein VGR06_40815 [Actinophytocola sp.]|uniref:hypothetical protein n=1 Tax=Actinophytocola sp. TaxID=1872138 RepID=UPI002E05AE79|nr:hypothetical protein [Actinophytocola sp.]